jgi:isopentenyl phosphate kinase
MLKFLKLGGSLITHKDQPNSVRQEVLVRVSTEIARALRETPDLSIVLGHGSGSFGHTAASEHGTMRGVYTQQDWAGFCKVAQSAARLSALVCDALIEAGVAAYRFQPSASGIARSSSLVMLSTTAIHMALDAHLVAVVHGDTMFDQSKGGTIISTEQIFDFLVPELHPEHLVMAGDSEGVLDIEGKVIKHITPLTVTRYASAIGASAYTDVTGGMFSKVMTMLKVCEQNADLKITILSGLVEGNIYESLVNTNPSFGTTLSAD